MARKIIVLLVVLALPGMIYYFLRFFGANEFDVAPMFQEGAIFAPAGCLPVSAPYTIPESIFKDAMQDQSDSLVLIVMEENILSLISRAKGEWEGNQGIPIAQGLPEWACGLLLSPGMDIVLVDSSRRIRGQYRSAVREDVDRLFTELDIIMKRY